MTRLRYLIVGGGMTANAAIHGIREVDPVGSITLIGDESDPPYKRPPLSKGLWSGKPLASIWHDMDGLGVDLRLGRAVRWLDLTAKRVCDDRGEWTGFDRLLLATGSRPRRLFHNGNRIILFRTVEDYRRLSALAESGQHFAVIGNGFIGAEIAAALTTKGKAVTMIFPGAAIGERIFPADLAGFLNDVYRARGVAIMAGTSATGLAERGDGLLLQTTSGDLAVDGVVAGIGTEPNVELAQEAGLAVDGGIVVDEFLRTSHPDVYAAGDVAAFPVPALGDRRRIEHEDNATTMGRHAGRAMAGDSAPYRHLPFFYSDLFDLGYEAVGDLDARLDTTADWRDPYREGVIYYRRDNRVRGVLLWNVWDQVEAARALIAGEKSTSRGRLPALA
jgi:NADPH-dependent 2,4-dienoyl-CoA reductase/sulfur reductase-like enzyme